ncbi:DUF2214 family protein [Chitinophaga agrisoli]|uniref:DUF2214 family protein n=1 Tax=Chitinophaga agrisoli TaxID=2607653 RepID=A0A5B2VUX1_9BACT|nr:DUF2214 family protein [Chitinophaga agrisoli]KAA2241889.1 DUF2214 family protein [Chitinophaga agrisoli]
MTKTEILLRLLLTLHITGLVVMAGATLIDYITFRTFWDFADHGNSRSSLGLLPLMAKYGALVRTGAGILFISGIAMFMIKNSWWEQPWFKVKLVLVAILILHGILVGNRTGINFRKMVVDNSPDFIQHVVNIRVTLNRFYLIQLALFFVIILVSVLRSGRGS